MADTKDNSKLELASDRERAEQESAEDEVDTLDRGERGDVDRNEDEDGDDGEEEATRVLSGNIRSVIANLTTSAALTQKISITEGPSRADTETSNDTAHKTPSLMDEDEDDKTCVRDNPLRAEMTSQGSGHSESSLVPEDLKATIPRGRVSVVSSQPSSGKRQSDIPQQKRAPLPPLPPPPNRRDSAEWIIGSTTSTGTGDAKKSGGSRPLPRVVPPPKKGDARLSSVNPVATVDNEDDEEATRVDDRNSLLQAPAIVDPSPSRIPAELKATAAFPLVRPPKGPLPQNAEARPATLPPSPTAFTPTITKEDSFVAVGVELAPTPTPLPKTFRKPKGPHWQTIAVHGVCVTILAIAGGVFIQRNLTTSPASQPQNTSTTPEDNNVQNIPPAPLQATPLQAETTSVPSSTATISTTHSSPGASPSSTASNTPSAVPSNSALAPTPHTPSTNPTSTTPVTINR